MKNILTTCFLLCILKFAVSQRIPDYYINYSQDNENSSLEQKTGPEKRFYTQQNVNLVDTLLMAILGSQTPVLL